MSINSPSFKELKQRIKDIKERNLILSKKFKRSELNRNVTQTQKRKILEISAVEKCNEKAMKLTEHCSKVKKARKQTSIQLQSPNKRFSDSDVACGPRIRKKCQNHEPNPFISQNNNFVDDSFDEQCAVTPVENKVVTALNEEEIFIDSKSLTSTPNKRKRKHLPDDLIHLSDSCQKTKHLKTTLGNSDFNKNSKDMPRLNTIGLVDGNNSNPDSSDNIVFLQSISTTKKKRNSQKCDAPNKSKIYSEIKKSKRSKSNKDPQIALNYNSNESYDEAIQNSVISVKTTAKLTDEPKENSNVNCLPLSKKSISKLVKVPLASYKEFEHQTAKTRSYAKNTLKKPVKFPAQKLDVIKDPAEKIITDISLLEVPGDTIMTKLDLTAKHGGIEKNVVHSTENLSKTIALERDLTEEPVETVIPGSDLTEKYGKKIVPGFKLTQDSTEVIIPEVDLTEDCDEEIFDLTQVSNESILRELDFTKEPVDFPIPELHLDESIRVSSKKMKFLKSKGILIRSGAWLKTEEKLLRRNFRDFQTQFKIYDTRLLLGFGRRLPTYKHKFKQIKKFLKAKHFYVRLGKDINDRTLSSIYDKACQIFNSYKKREDITPKELTYIFELQLKHGNNWTLIGQKLGISPVDCKEIYYYRNKRYRKGNWSASEINTLISAIKTVTNKSILNDKNIKGISWKRVAEFVPTRNYLQCYNEWQIQSKLS